MIVLERFCWVQFNAMSWTVIQAEMEKREQSLDVLQDRVVKLKDCARLQKTPLQMQVSAVEKRNLSKSIDTIEATYSFSIAI